MKDFLEAIVKQLVEQPEKVSVVETTDEGKITLQIKVADEDMGRVIGKEGKVINAIRMIMRVMAIRQNVRVRIDIEDNRPHVVATTTSEVTPQTEVAAQEDEVTEVVTTPADVEEAAEAVATEPTPSDLVGKTASVGTTVLDNSTKTA